MINNFLLTYDCWVTQPTGSGFIDSKYSWFESEEELRDFVDEMKKRNSHFKVNEAIEILNDRQITLL